jgi:hypothetical protein
MNEFAARAAMQARVRGRALAAKDGCSARNPMVQGAAPADCTMICGFGVDITQAVPDGAPVEVDPESDPLWLRVLAEA